MLATRLVSYHGKLYAECTRQPVEVLSRHWCLLLVFCVPAIPRNSGLGVGGVRASEVGDKSVRRGPSHRSAKVVRRFMFRYIQSSISLAVARRSTL